MVEIIDRMLDVDRQIVANSNATDRCDPSLDNTSVVTDHLVVQVEQSIRCLCVTVCLDDNF